jgi:nucleotide-binding universal stress UspA family protein
VQNVGVEHELEHQAPPAPRPLLLCFDGSEEAAEAIRRAGALMPGREAVVLTVAVPAGDQLPLDPLSDLVGRFSGLYRDWDESVAELAEHQARRGCELAAESGLAPRPLTATGKAAPTILRIADEQDVDVIVLGERRRAAFGGLLGSVAARVVQHATRPVLVVPARTERQ